MSLVPKGRRPLVQIIFGWPAVCAAFVVFGLALFTASTWLAFTAAAIATPFCLFVTGYPMFRWAGWVALAANFLSACLMRRRREIAFAALVPFMMIVTLLAVFAAREITLVRR